MLPLKPDRLVLLSSALFWMVIYLTVFFIFQDAIPEKYLRDANIIENLVEGKTTIDGEDDSFAAVVLIFSIFPQYVNYIVVGLLNCYILWRILSQVQTFLGMVLIILVLVPMAVSDMMELGKETIVLMITLLILIVSEQGRSRLPVMLTILGCYIVYGTFVRNYYLLIIVTFLGYLILDKLKGGARLFYLLFVLLGIFLLPQDVYQSLEGARDAVYYQAALDTPVRTSFVNPFPPDSGMHFLGNYAYALCLLNFPFLMDVTLNEVVMFINVVIYASLIRFGVRHLPEPQRLLTFLFVAHITVLILFEPDFGSYVRHFSSVFLYLLPAFALQEQKHAQALKQNQGNSTVKFFS
jgi:hypothetical protein